MKVYTCFDSTVSLPKGLTGVKCVHDKQEILYTSPLQKAREETDAAQSFREM